MRYSLRTMKFSVGLAGLSIMGSALIGACGGSPDVVVPGDDGEAGTGATGATGATGNEGGDGAGATGGTIPIGGKGGGAGKGGSGGNPVDPCDTLDCGAGQRCEVTDGEAECIDNTCDDLECEATEECQPVASGGNRCVDISCTDDADCPAARFCNADGVCSDDVCEPDTRRCDGSEVIVCSSNGGEDTPAYECSSLGPDRFQSECSDDNPATTGCSCEDDWDCPPFTACETGTCTGTGVAPTCTLPPTPFEEVLPQMEFRWGGENNGSQSAPGKAFPWSAQVGATPLVVNLDDDNGDGRVNELDFPEIVFISYHGTAADNNGLVRAVHAGGPAKGTDYFAVCGSPERPATPAGSYADADGAYWSEGEPVLEDCDDDAANDSRDEAKIRGSGVLAAGDLDADGFPEIVAPTENGGLLILNNRGEVMVDADLDWPGGGEWKYPAPAIANLDFTGRPEIVVGNFVVVLAQTGALAVERVFQGEAMTGTMHHGDDEGHHGPTVCPADLTSHPGLEIVAGSSLYRMPDVTDCTAEPTSDYCENRLTVVWNAADVPENAATDFYPEGFCAVADVLGADTAAAPGPTNGLDGVPEVIIHADGRILIFEAETGIILRDLAPSEVGNGTEALMGGAANVDDFDGDGFPELAVAGAFSYSVVDLQEPEATNCPAWPTLLPQTGVPPGANTARNPGGTDAEFSCTSNADCNTGAVCNQQAGKCVCLHNGWRRDTEDDSSRVTSSSVFDFNGDGAAEVVYNDECYFRVYDGATGGIYLAIPSLSRTIIENPVVADVDNDGNAEIVFVQNNETLQCGEVNLDSWPDGDNDVSRAELPNGLEVWGDPSDVWVAARRVWNQHSYHVTNVLESGGIPLHEPESWKPLNGRLYNTYRSQPRVYGVAPDLALTAIQVSSPGAMCGMLSDEIEITVVVKNEGDLRVGPGVVLEFFGTWPDGEEGLLDANGDPLSVVLDKSLEPGASTLVTVTYEVGNNAAPHDEELPSSVRATIDGGNDAANDGAERECHEDNNEIDGPVDAGEELPDVSIAIDADDCDGEVEVTVTNDGSSNVSDVVVRVYAGDPSAGGELLGEGTVPGPIAPGESDSVIVDVGSIVLNVTLWGVADPLDAIVECNDANNIVEGPYLECDIIPR
jgi:hypothetical protein